MDSRGKDGKGPSTRGAEAPTPGKAINVRRQERTPCSQTDFRTFFSNGYLEGEGTLVNLSTQGCRIDCPTEIEAGASVELWLFLPDYDWPLKIDKAEVRWKEGDVLGVEFVSLRPAQRDRLRRLLKDRNPDNPPEATWH